MQTTSINLPIVYFDRNNKTKLAKSCFKTFMGKAHQALSFLNENEKFILSFI